MDTGTIEFEQIMMIFPVNFLGEPFFNEKPKLFPIYYWVLHRGSN